MAHSFNPKDVWQPFGAFSQVVISGAGRTIYLKGQVALGPDGEVVGERDMAVQVDQVLRNISNVLTPHGWSNERHCIATSVHHGYSGNHALW